MAKKKKKVSNENACCSWCCWSRKEWVLAAVSELALFGFLWYLLKILGAMGNLYWGSLVLLVLINVSLVACPVFRKHYM